MRKLLVKVAVATIAVSVAAWLLPGIRLGGPEDDWTQLLGTALGVGAILAVIRTILKPLLTFLSLPLLLLTLGLFGVVIGAVLLWLTSLAAGEMGLRFHVAKFWWDAVLGSLIVTLSSLLVEPFFGDHDHVRLSRSGGSEARADRRAGQRNSARDDLESGRQRRAWNA